MHDFRGNDQYLYLRSELFNQMLKISHLKFRTKSVSNSYRLSPLLEVISIGLFIFFQKSFTVAIVSKLKFFLISTTFQWNYPSFYQWVLPILVIAVFLVSNECFDDLRWHSAWEAFSLFNFPLKAILSQFESHPLSN